MKSTFLLCTAFCSAAITTRAQIINGCFTIGDNNMELMRAVIQTSDGGYAFAGLTASYVDSDNQNDYVVKTDANGNVQWNMGLGTSSFNTIAVYDMIQTTDGGYALAGVSDFNSMGLVKLNAAGAVEWSKAYDAGDPSDLYAVVQTPDGGYLVAGSGSVPGNVSPLMVAIKTDAQGEIEWSKAYYYDFGTHEAYDAVVVPGGYALCGYHTATGGGMPVLRLDDDGDVLWAKSYGPGNEIAEAIAATPDGGLVVAGYTANYGYAVQADNQFDGFVAKLDQNGDLDWARAFGDTLSDFFRSITITSDGGYAMAGRTGLLFGSPPIHIYVAKCDANGELLWSQMLAHDLGGEAWDIVECSDGGLAVTGVDVVGVDQQAVLMKMEADGTICPDCGPEAYGQDSVAVLTPVDLTITVYDSVATSTDFILNAVPGGTAVIGCLETGVGEIGGTGAMMTIAPNPAEEHCIVSLNSAAGVDGLELTSLQESTVLQIAMLGRTQVEVPLDHLPPAVYLLMTVGTGASSRTRLVVAR